MQDRQPRWASTDDPVGDIAIRLAAHASAVEEEEGEWAWRDLAKLVAEMLATRPQPTDEMVEKLRAALRPFVEEFEARRDAYIRRYPRNPSVGANNFDAMPDSWEMEGSNFSMGTFRAAVAAMGEGR